jgi:hypothetical protein
LVRKISLKSFLPRSSEWMPAIFLVSVQVPQPCSALTDTPYSRRESTGWQLQFYPLYHSLFPFEM